MDPEIRSSLLWGAVGALAFLVGLQGYHIIAGEFVGFGVMFGVALVVGVASAAATHVTRGLLAGRNERT